MQLRAVARRHEGQPCLLVTACSDAVVFRLAAQLARTEEAAKRALARSDQGAKGSTVQQLLNAQQQVQQLQTENIQLSSKLAK